MVTIEVEVTCPYCGSNKIVKNGKDENCKQRFLCKEEQCKHQTFLINYTDIGRQPHIKDLILKIAINGSGIRDTARVLGVNPDTVIETLKNVDRRIDNVNNELLKKKLKKV